MPEPMTDERLAHTPTPWAIKEGPFSRFRWIYHLESDGLMLGVADMLPLDSENEPLDTARHFIPLHRDVIEANARFIIVACNAYDANQAEIDRLRAENAAERKRSERRRIMIGDLQIRLKAKAPCAACGAGSFAQCSTECIIAAEIADTGEVKGEE